MALTIERESLVSYDLSNHEEKIAAHKKATVYIYQEDSEIKLTLIRTRGNVAIWNAYSDNVEFHHNGRDIALLHNQELFLTPDINVWGGFVDGNNVYINIQAPDDVIIHRADIKHVKD